VCKRATSTPRSDTLFNLYPGTEAMEREAFDLFGVLFRGHPDLTRILMPEEWEDIPYARTTPSVKCPCSSRKRRVHGERAHRNAWPSEWNS